MNMTTIDTKFLFSLGLAAIMASDLSFSARSTSCFKYSNLSSSLSPSGEKPSKDKSYLTLSSSSLAVLSVKQILCVSLSLSVMVSSAWESSQGGFKRETYSILKTISLSCWVNWGEGACCEVILMVICCCGPITPTCGLTLNRSGLVHRTLKGTAILSESFVTVTLPFTLIFQSCPSGRQLCGLNVSINNNNQHHHRMGEWCQCGDYSDSIIIINLIKRMWNKTHTQSNEETEDGEEEDRESNVRGLLEQTVPIVDVWAHNFDAELQILAQMAKFYPVLAFDTEFPGSVVTRSSLSNYYPQEELDYQHTWHNVQRTKLIQVGFTLGDPSGALPARNATWQFHLQFDLQRESLVPESIQMLREAGIDFEKLRTQGIPHRRFAEGLFASGLILNKNIKWVVFHGCFDFGYLLRQLRREPLPRTAEEFYKSLKIYFPCIYDLKQILKDEEQFRQGGLSAISQRIGCARVGPQHQAGSDSLLTLNCYFRLRKILGDMHFEQRANCIFGIAGEQYPKVSGYQIMSYPQAYQITMSGYLNYNHTFQIPYPHTQNTTFQKQWPH